MLTCDKVLAKILRAIKNKKDQTAKIAEMLGPNRILRAWLDTNNSAKYPALTGTEFLNLEMDGTMTFSAGALTGFGIGKKTNKFNAVNLLTGKAVMRIQGNGYYVQGTLGVNGDFDFILEENPTPEKGLAFANTSALNAYKFLPSGIGSKAPTRTRKSPYALKVYSYENPKAPQKVLTSYITNRIDDLVMEDAEMSRNLGDTAVYQTTATPAWGKFVMGATLLISDKNNTETGLAPLEQLMILFAYRDSVWNTYPANNNFHRQSMVMNLPAFKIFMTNEDGEIMHIFQMPDGIPVNSKTLNSGNLDRGGRTTTAALNPQFNCAMALPWQSARAKKSDIANKIYPGLLNYRDSMSKGQSSMISVEPLITGGYGGSSANGLADFWYASKKPLPFVEKTLTDPYLDNRMNANGSSAQFMGWAEGIDYIIGQYGCHNWYTSPGGPRNDRGVIPSVTAMYLTYPNGNRLEENLPWRDLVEAWNMNSFNHSNHFVFDPNTVETMPAKELFNDQWGPDGTYYGSYFRELAITFSGDQRDGTGAWNFDMEGNMHLAGWARDYLHNYHNRGWGSMTFCSPLHAVGSKFDTITSLLLHQNPFGGVNQGYYMVRYMAWHWLHIVIGWKNGTKHKLGFAQSDFETYFGRVLLAIYNEVYKPAFVDNVDTSWARGLRQLGIPLWPQGNTYAEGGGRLGFYLGHVLQLMKQTGFWHRMRSLDPRYGVVLDNVIRNMDTFCFGNMVDAQGQNFGGGYYTMGDGQNLSSIPASWKAWYDSMAAREDHDSDFIYQTVQSNGVWTHRKYSANYDVSSNQWEQYARMRADYFPEIAHPKMTAAIAEFDRYATIVTDIVNAATTPGDKRSLDYFYRYPSIAPFKGPAPGDLVLA